ncbi:MAG: FdtA/QdtA family cupin domain-containing protein [Ginsengibacter sp.]
MSTKEPYIIKFPKIGESVLGYISIAEKENLPFEVKRIYWTFFTPESVERGGHAHHQLEQVLIAVAGKIIITTELLSGEKEEFILDNPYTGLYMPKMTWRTMKYSHNSVQVCIANKVYEEKDYIRDYNVFKNLNKNEI